MFPRWGITYLIINLSPRTFITYVFPRSFPTKYITKLRMKYQSDVISLYLIFRSPVFPRCFPGVSPLLIIIIMKSKSVGCHFIIMIFIDFPRCFPGVSPVFIIIPASALRFGAASLENAAHFAVRDALQAVRGPATLLTCKSTHPHDARLGCRVRRKHIL